MTVVSVCMGNQLEKAFEKLGFKSERKIKKPKHKKFTCHLCNSPMLVIEDTNVMVCTNEKCANYYIFDV